MGNPFTPGSGITPTRLVGREGFVEAFTSLLDGLTRGHTQRSIVATGLRGVGKTVLLREFVSAARSRNWAVVDIDAARRDDDGFRRQMAFELRGVLLALAPRARWDNRVLAASAVLGSFASSLGQDNPLGSEWTDAAAGTADSGNLSADLTALLLAVGEAASERERGVVFVVDELQNWTVGQYGALVDALQRTLLRELPITMAGAGLPRSDAVPAQTRARAARLFEFPVLDSLSDADAAALLGWNGDAVSAAQGLTGGNCFFLQALGHVVWEARAGADAGVSRADVEAATASYFGFLDAGFFADRFGRSGELELAYLRAVVETPVEAETARKLDRTVQQCAETRAGLLEKSLLYSADDGSVSFTAPGVEQYLQRVMPTLVVPAAKARRRRYDP